MYYSIGEFSKLTNLTPKMLKLYQEKELLIPAKVDEFSKYRYYDQDNLETAKLIRFFKQFDFSLAEIKEIVDNQDDESIVSELLEKQKDVIEDKITKYNFVMGLINEKLIRRTTMTEIDSASKQRSRFWKIFANLLKNNIPLNECLETAGKNADEELKAVLPDIINEVKQNNNLSDILNDNKVIFTNLEILVIANGEKYDILAKGANGIGNILDEFGFPDNTEEKKNTRSNYWNIFGALIDIGNTITKSMKIAADWADEKIKSATDQMIEEIHNGNDLITTFKARPEIFTELEIEMDRIGETYGHLEEMIHRLPIIVRMIEETEGEEEKRKNFWKLIGDYEGEDFKAEDERMKIFIKGLLEKYPDSEEIRKFWGEGDFNYYREAIHIALFAADEKLKEISEEILKDISNNKTLSSIMERHPDIFQEFETKFIALGESNKDIGKAANELVEIL